MRKDYRVMTDIGGLEEYISGADIVAFDYEASPDDEYRDDPKASLDSNRSHIVGCSFSVKRGTAVYVPVAHRVGKNMETDTFYSFLRDFLTNDHIVKVAHNIAYEAMQSYGKGIVIQPPVYDTMCASQMILNGDSRYRTMQESGLKLLSAEVLGEVRDSFEDTVEGRHFDEMDPADLRTVTYACADADDALRLYHIFNTWFDRYLHSIGLS